MGEFQIGLDNPAAGVVEGAGTEQGSPYVAVVAAAVVAAAVVVAAANAVSSFL